jgi:hypothetical protein
MYMTCLVAFLAVLSMADIPENGAMVAEIGTRDISAHGALAEKAGNSLMRSESSPKDAHAHKATVKSKSPHKDAHKAIAKSKSAHKGESKSAHKAVAKSKSAHKLFATSESGVVPDHLYKVAVEADNPVAFWPLSDPDGAVIQSLGLACGPDGTQYGDPCLSNAHLRTPTHPVTLRAGCLFSMCQNDDNSIYFNGTDQLIAMPGDNVYLNYQDTGYPEKTVELWMRPEGIDAHPRVVFAMGRGNHSGISIYVKKDYDNLDKLFMYAWNQVEFQTLFGQDEPPIAPTPLSCEIQPNKVYYIAFVFDQADYSYTGYIKHEGNDAVEECGKISGLPSNSKLAQMNEGGHGCIGGVSYDTRFNATTEGRSPYGFEGKLQWVAMYNHALNLTSLQAHADAAKR